jgi:hypothetical protein
MSAGGLKWREVKIHTTGIMGFGITVKEAPDSSIRNMAMRLFIDALPMSEHFCSPRALGYTVIALEAYLSIYGGDSYARKIRDITATNNI